MTFYKYAGFWQRLVAFTIDGAIVSFIFIIFFIIASMAFFSGAISADSKNLFADLTDPASLSPVMISIWMFYIFINLIYFTYFHGASGRTPGKMILGLQVVTDQGKPLTFGIAFLRSVGYFISNILYLGFLWVAFDRKKQGWHDKIAGTVVIVMEKGEQTAGISIPGSSPPLSESTTVKPPENNDN
jgi:uncharacterized RDD family membrane protein YckC